VILFLLTATKGKRKAYYAAVGEIGGEYSRSTGEKGKEPLNGFLAAGTLLSRDWAGRGESRRPNAIETEGEEKERLYLLGEGKKGKPFATSH